MDISDKIIIFCIIFAILAILSIVFGCYYLNNKQEGFKNKSKESLIIEELKNYFTNNAEDFTIIEFMQKHKSFFKNEKFVDRVVEALTNEEFLKKKEPFKKSKENANFVNKKEHFKKSKKNANFVNKKSKNK